MLKITHEISRFSESITDILPVSAQQNFRLRLLASENRKKNRESFRFLRNLCRDYPEYWPQWKALFHRSMLSEQEWVLVGGTYHGTKILICQRDRVRTVRIRCPSDEIAEVFRQMMPLAENACRGPWVDVFIKIETESGTNLLPSVVDA